MRGTDRKRPEVLLLQMDEHFADKTIGILIKMWASVVLDTPRNRSSLDLPSNPFALRRVDACRDGGANSPQIHTPVPKPSNPQPPSNMKSTAHLAPEPLEDRIAPAGVIAVAYDSHSGALTLTGDAFDNSVNVLKTGTDTHRIEGLAGTSLAGPGGSATSLDLGKVTSVKIIGNDGADDFAVTDLAGLKSFSFDGGAGLDFLYATNLGVKGDVKLTLGADSALVAFAGASTVIGGDVTADYGTGGGSVDFFAESTSVKGTVTLKGGTGDDGATFGNAVTIDKGLVVTDAGGGMAVAFHDATAVIGKGRGNQSIQFTGGSGDDSLEFIDGSASLKGGLEFEGGAGNDTFDVSAILRVGGDLSADGGTGSDVVNIVTDQLSVSHDVELSGGDGDDDLSLIAKSLSIGHDLSIRGGNGSNLGTTFADGTIRGDVEFDMGGADGTGDQTFLLGGFSGAVGALKIGGDLKVESDATDPTNAGYSDYFSATDVTVGKDVSIRMGAVDSTVSLDNLFVDGALSIKTDAGNDTVDIERGGLTGPSIIDRIASIQLGDGDDILRIGRSSAAGSNDFVIFGRGLLADGGAGTDASNDFLNDEVNVFRDSNDHDDDDDDCDDRGRTLKERVNFEGAFLS